MALRPRLSMTMSMSSYARVNAGSAAVGECSATAIPPSSRAVMSAASVAPMRLSAACLGSGVSLMAVALLGRSPAGELVVDDFVGAQDDDRPQQRAVVVLAARVD